MSVINENALRLRTRASGGRPTLLKITPNRYNRVSFSARVGESWINADLTIDEWRCFCQYIRMATRLKEPDTFAIQLKKKEQIYGAIVVGQDIDGLVYIEMGNTDKGKVRFDFLPKHQFVHMRSGKPVTEGEITRIRALNWADLVGPMVEREWEKEYKVEDAQGSTGFGGQQRPYNNNQNRGGNGGGYNGGGYNGGGNGGYQKPSAPAADGDLEAYLP